MRYSKANSGSSLLHSVFIGSNESFSFEKKTARKLFRCIRVLKLCASKYPAQLGCVLLIALPVRGLPYQLSKADFVSACVPFVLCCRLRRSRERGQSETRDQVS